MKLSNFRDLHDVYAPIQKGKLFRSDAPLNFEQEDWDELYDLGIRVLIDFRSELEIQEDGYQWDDRFVHYNWCALMPETGIDDFYFPRLVTKQSTREEIFSLSSFIRKGYQVIPFSNTAFQNCFQLMLECEDGILFHCGSGKDRTGIFSALVLSLFGCEKDIIFQDYLFSNESVKTHLMPILYQSDYSQEIKDTLAYVCSVHEELLQSSFDAIYSRYETMEDFFSAEYAFDSEQLIRKYIL
ncbi:MAG: tyrosine-protein phosphatase [Floccifex sp.]